MLNVIMINVKGTKIFLFFLRRVELRSRKFRLKLFCLLVKANIITNCFSMKLISFRSEFFELLNTNNDIRKALKVSKRLKRLSLVSKSSKHAEKPYVYNGGKLYDFWWVTGDKSPSQAGCNHTRQHSFFSLLNREPEGNNVL